MDLILDRWEREDLERKYGKDWTKLKRPSLTSYEDSMGNINSPEMDKLLQDAREFMSNMSPRRAKVCHLYFTQGLTTEEIAEREDMAVGSVKNLISEVGKLLRKRYVTEKGSC